MATARTPAMADSSLAGPRKYACVKCQQRKVRCDRLEPCSNCKRSLRQCEYKAPPPPRRRPRKTADLSLHARIKHYADLLKKLGVHVEDINPDDPMTGVENENGGEPAIDIPDEEPDVPSENQQAPATCPLVTSNGAAHNLQNSLWGDIREEELREDELPESDPTVPPDFDDDAEASDQPSRNDDPNELGLTEGTHFILGGDEKGLNIDQYHPRPDVAMRLWRVFLENVDPLCKVFHVPTTHKLLAENVGKAAQGGMSKSTCALTFTIYLFAVTSMTPSEVETVTGEARSLLLRRYRRASQVALVRASLLQTQELAVVQAFTLFLMAVRQFFHSRSLWVLVGIAVRVAQRMGLHVDGQGTGLTPFDVEMRRRLWWQIIMLDRTTAEMSGAAELSSSYNWDTKLPLNVEDRELDPDMKELPHEREGATDMIFCLLRYDFCDIFRNKRSTGLDEASAAPWVKLTSRTTSMAEKDQVIEEVQRRFGHKYLRYCDPLNKLHFIVSVVAHSVVNRLYLAAHHPRQCEDKGKGMPQAEKDVLFEKSVKIIEYRNVIQSSPMARGYLWYFDNFFMWQAFLFLLDYLVQHPACAGWEHAWQQVEVVYHDHPFLVTKRSNTLYSVVRGLTLRAWDGREAQQKQSGIVLQPPDFVSRFREKMARRIRKEQTRRRESDPTKSTAKAGAPSSTPVPLGQGVEESRHTPEGSGAISDSTFMDFDTPTDWSQWDELIGGFEWQNFDAGWTEA